MFQLKLFPVRIAVARRLVFVPLLLGALLLAGCAVEFPLISAPEPSLTEILSRSDDPTVDAFVDELAVALAARDYPQLQGMMANPFSIMWWQAQAVERPAGVALLTLRDAYLGAGSAVAFREARSLAGLENELALPLHDSAATVVRALYVVGLGADQGDEALLLIARHNDGTPFWQSVVLADSGFPVAEAQAATTVALGDTVQERMTAMNMEPESYFLLTLRNVHGETVAGAPFLPQVQFAEDAKSATIRGVIQPVQERSYLLNPLTSAELLFTLRSVSPAVQFSITGMEDQHSYKASDDAAQLWQGKLPATQAYVVSVRSNVAQPFELAITVATDAVVGEVDPAAMADAPVASADAP